MIAPREPVEFTNLPFKEIITAVSILVCVWVCVWVCVCVCVKHNVEFMKESAYKVTLSHTSVQMSVKLQKKGPSSKLCGGGGVRILKNA